MPDTINMRREGYKLVPCSFMDEETLREFPVGKDLTVTIARSRRPKHHRFFMALIKKICENHDTYKRPEQLILWLKIRLGHVEEIRFHDDKVWWVAKSISFFAMGQDEFRKFFNASLDIIITEVIPGLNQEELLREVEEMVGFSVLDIWSEKHGV